jgi:hypothetical protein
MNIHTAPWEEESPGPPEASVFQSSEVDTDVPCFAAPLAPVPNNISGGNVGGAVGASDVGVSVGDFVGDEDIGECVGDMEGDVEGELDVGVLEGE